MSISLCLSRLFSVPYVYALSFWGLGKSFALLSAFALSYGMVAGGFTTLYSRLSRRISDENEATGMTTYSMFLFERGLGNIVTGPVSGVLVGMGNGSAQTGQYALGKY